MNDLSVGWLLGVLTIVLPWMSWTIFKLKRQLERISPVKKLEASSQQKVGFVRKVKAFIHAGS